MVCVRFSHVFLTGLFLAIALPASSQKLTEMKHRLGSILTAKYQPADGWLLHLSALPTFIVYSNTSLTMGDTSKGYWRIAGSWILDRAIGDEALHRAGYSWIGCYYSASALPKG